MYEILLTWAYCNISLKTELSCSVFVRYINLSTLIQQGLLEYSALFTFYINTTFIRISTICVSSAFASEMGPVSSLTWAIWGSLIPKINTWNTPHASTARINHVWFPFIPTSEGGIQIRLIQTHKHSPFEPHHMLYSCTHLQTFQIRNILI